MKMLIKNVFLSKIAYSKPKKQYGFKKCSNCKMKLFVKIFIQKITSYAR